MKCIWTKQPLWWILSCLCGDFSIHNHTTLQAEIKHKADGHRGGGSRKWKESTPRSRGSSAEDRGYPSQSLNAEKGKEENRERNPGVLWQRNGDGVRCALWKMRLASSLVPDGLQELPEHGGSKKSTPWMERMAFLPSAGPVETMETRAGLTLKTFSPVRSLAVKG